MIQAAIRLTQLKVLDEEIQTRQKIAERYDKALGGSFQIPYVRDGMASVYAQYALLAENRERRDKIMEALKAVEIPLLMYY